MKKLTKTTLIILAVILVIIIAFSLLKNKKNTTTEEIAKCIGERSTLYVKLGCHYCAIQEELFGEDIQYLNKIDCFYESSKCEEISATPTWKIKGKDYVGVQTIEKLQELTGC